MNSHGDEIFTCILWTVVSVFFVVQAFRKFQECKLLRAIKAGKKVQHYSFFTAFHHSPLFSSFFLFYDFLFFNSVSNKFGVRTVPQIYRKTLVHFSKILQSCESELAFQKFHSEVRQYMLYEWKSVKNTAFDLSCKVHSKSKKHKNLLNFPFLLTIAFL